MNRTVENPLESLFYPTLALFQVLVLRELAISVPTFFFQQVQPFFDNIFVAVWDPKQAIREGAVSALRACLILTTQRESKEMQKPQWYRVRRERSGAAAFCGMLLSKFLRVWVTCRLVHWV